MGSPHNRDSSSKEEILKKNKTSFAGDVAKLVSGTVFAQLLSVVISPILTRLYGPEAFGISTLFLSIASVFTVVSCLRYELSIMLPKDDQESANLLFLCLTVSIVTSVASGILVMAGDTFIVRVLKAPELKPYLWMLPIYLFMSAFFLPLNYWNSRTKHYTRLSASKIAGSASTAAIQLSAGYAGLATGGSLIGANVAGSAVSTGILTGRIWRDNGVFFRANVTLKGMFAGMKRHKKFPIYGTGTAFLNAASWQLPSFLLAAFFSPAIVGYYALGTRVLRLPMNLVGTAIAQVFFQRASEAKNEGKLHIVVENVFGRLVAVGMFPLLVLTIVGRDLFEVVFGPSWSEAGVYMQILGVWTFFWFISSPMTTLFSVLEKQEFGLKLHTTLFLTRLLSLGLGGYMGSPRVALMLFSSTGIIVYAYLTMAIMANAGVRWSRMFRILWSNFIIFVPAGTVLIILKLFGLKSWGLVSISIVILIGYAGYIYRKDPSIKHLFKKSDANGQTNPEC